MRKIFIILIFLKVFNFSLEVKSAEYLIEEKTDDYVIVINKDWTNIAGRFLSLNTHYAVPNIVIDALRNIDDLEKRFDIAQNYCSTLSKPTILTYRLIPSSKTPRWFGNDYDLKVFDEDTTGDYSRLRFFCADDIAQAAQLYNKYTFINENGKNSINLITWEKFKSRAAQKFTTETSENSNWKFDIRQTEEVRKKNFERIEAKKIEQEKELQKKLELARLEADKIEVEKIKKEKKFKLTELEKIYGKKCESGLFKKISNEEYNNCLLDYEAKSKEIEKKKLIAQKEKERQIFEAENKKLVAQQEKQKKIADAEQAKKKAAETKIQEEQIKMSKMSPDDRRAFTCNEKFGFRKGSDKFKDCIFELYKAETELEKLELQKQVAKANADAARANAEAVRAGAERQERLALAQTEAAKMQALAARQQAIAANTADSLALIESGLRMMSPQRPAVVPMRTCTYNRNFMNCF